MSARRARLITVFSAMPARDPQPPANPLRRVGRDLRFNIAHRRSMPPGVSWSDLGYVWRHVSDPLGEFQRVAATHGGVFSLPVLHQRQVLAVSPTATQEILVTKAGAFGWRGGNFGELIPLLGAGLITSDGDAHDVARRLLMPAFHRGQIRAQLSIMQQEAERAVGGWSSGDVVDVDRWARDLTMRIAMRALLGFDPDDDDQGRRAARLFDEGMAFFGTGVSRALRGPGTPWRRMQRARAQLHELVQRRIDERRHHPEADGADVLSMLVGTELPDGARLADEQVRDQLVTLLFAGHDTARATIAFLLYEIARDPALQDALAAERGSAGNLGVADAVTRMPLLEQAIDETLRLYPPVWIGGRMAMRDVELDGHPIPRGAYVSYSPYITHRLESVFEDPTAFRPRRFEAGSREQIPRGGYVPFGGGQRICIGRRFALTLVSAVAATVLERHRLVLHPGTRLRLWVVPTLTPAGGLDLLVG